MKGALPVPYIVAIVIAIVVIAVLVYWFFVLSGQGGGTAIEQFCLAKRFTYCSSWAAVGYDPEKQPGKKEFAEWAPECGTYTWAKAVSMTACKEALGQKSTS